MRFLTTDGLQMTEIRARVKVYVMQNKFASWAKLFYNQVEPSQDT